MPDNPVSGGGLRGHLGKIRSDWRRKQPKTCVWVSVVGGKAFLQRSQITFREWFGRATSCTLRGKKLRSIRIAYGFYSGLWLGIKKAFIMKAFSFAQKCGVFFKRFIVLLELPLMQWCTRCHQPTHHGTSRSPVCAYLGASGR